MCVLDVHTDALSCDMCVLDVHTDALSVDMDSIPEEADFLVGYSTVPGSVSWRDTRRGSLYIHHLTETLDQLSDRYADLCNCHLTERPQVSHSIFNFNSLIHKADKASSP
jgi:hypothetical protein